MEASGGGIRYLVSEHPAVTYSRPQVGVEGGLCTTPPPRITIKEFKNAVGAFQPTSSAGGSTNLACSSDNAAF
ncbi:hypothetical protein M404DRAFT_1007479 [Pisolithus tinctorius Marx 270]|uniref:Uncharacterized protein n=1 Tax=Pisolithus tinctorius Marx 270 TaxID=870435 RepID=A0A0C3IEI6_PISTI|nr:hypothetical protein M404DRAFT_1007479 [Pisolithus tinctorius Marx 270]